MVLGTAQLCHDLDMHEEADEVTNDHLAMESDQPVDNSSSACSNTDTSSEHDSDADDHEMELESSAINHDCSLPNTSVTGMY